MLTAFKVNTFHFYMEKKASGSLNSGLVGKAGQK
jgi:hypothetical protein